MGGLIGGHEPQDINKVLKEKASIEDVKRLFEEKSNKTDTET
jgi:hypothetical protein